MRRSTRVHTHTRRGEGDRGLLKVVGRSSWPASATIKGVICLLSHFACQIEPAYYIAATLLDRLRFKRARFKLISCDARLLKLLKQPF